MGHTFVHLSDIHFGQEHNGNIHVHDYVKNEVLRDAKEMRKRIGPAEGIIVTGDIVFSAKQNEYDAAGKWLDTFCGEVGCETHEIHCIPGNHDINLNQIDAIGEQMHLRLREAPINDVDRILGDLAGSVSDPLFPKFQHYREFAARYNCSFESLRSSRWYKDLSLGNGNHIRFAGLNSVRVSDRGDERGNLILGNDQYAMLRQEGCEYVVLLHHPIEWCRDHEYAKSILQNARVILFGHEHTRSIRKVEELGQERLEIHSGALVPDQADGKYTYRYNWIEFGSEISDGACLLTVTIWSRVWNPELMMFTADTTLHTNGESTVYRIKCPEYHEHATPPVTQESTAQSICQTVTPPEQEISIMKDTEQHDFERLRYYFWKYLSWQQRLKVLADLDILPDTSDQPLPQILEQHALDLAKSAGKVAELWDAVMENVPAVDQAPNPF